MNLNRRVNLVSPFAFTFCAMILFSSFITMTASAASREPVTGILGALEEEVTLLEKQVVDKHETKIQGLRFVTGKLAGRKVVICQCGMGKVNAAMVTTLMIDHFQPSEVIFSGIAGGINRELGPGDLVIGTQVGQHDYGMITDEKMTQEGTLNPITGKKNPVLFTADKRLIELAGEATKHVHFDPVPQGRDRRLPKVVKGVIVTGDVFMASEKKCEDLRRTLGAEAVEMEGGSVAQVCYQMGTPFLIIRSLSDKADATAHVDVKVFIRIAAKNSALLVLQMVSMIEPAATTTAPAAGRN
jgi:adenosylhomocysteine nucleosidase